MILFLIYYFTASFGLKMDAVSGFATLVWPPTGIALAAIFLLGYRYWPAIVLAAFFVNLHAGAPIFVAAAMGIGNTLEALIGAYLLRRAHFNPSLTQIKDVLKLIIFAAIFSTLISGIFGVTSLWIAGRIGSSLEFRGTFSAWWLGDVMGNLIVAPLLFVWGSNFPKRYEGKKVIEAIALVITTLLVYNCAFHAIGPYDFFPTHHLYFIFPVLIWAGLRFRQHGTVFMLFFFSALSIVGTATGHGPFAIETLSKSLFNLQTFLAVLVITILIVTATNSQYEQEKLSLEKANKAVGVQHQVMLCLAESGSLREASPKILQIICENLEWDLGTLWLINETDQLIHATELWIAPGKEAPMFAEMTLAQNFQKGIGLPGRVWQSTEPVWIENLTLDPYFSRVDVAKNENIHSAFAFPIFSGNKKILGVLEFVSILIRKPDQELLMTISTLGGQIGQNMERYKSEILLKRSHDNLEKLVDERTADYRLAINEATKANQIKDLFLATLSHELRTPLTTILTWAQLLRSGRVDAETTKRGLEVVERSALTQGQLISDLLDVSRIQTGKMLLNIEELDPANVLLLAIDSVRLTAEKKLIGIETHIDSNQCKINADSVRLQQIFWNILTNAIKFTPQNGKITVGLKKLDWKIQIEIGDNGKGISPEFLPHIFESFSQQDSSTTRGYGGMGLGLSLVHDLVKLHGGKTQVKSEGLNKGATFTLEFPTKNSNVEVLKVDAPQTSNLAGLHLLLVDDEPDVRDAISLLLKLHGAEVRVAGSVREALSILPEYKPDVLLSDIAMPIEDGYGLIQKIRKIDSASGGNIPAIALTAYASIEDIRKAKEAGFNAHIAKPINVDELTKTIRKLVDSIHNLNVNSA